MFSPNLRYHLKDVILEGGIPFRRAYGMTQFEYLGTDPRFNRVFNEAMSNHTALIMSKILDVYRGFDGLEVLVDVGGGIGVTLGMITSRYPFIKGINFDLPNVLANAPSFPGIGFSFNTYELRGPQNYVIVELASFDLAILFINRCGACGWRYVRKYS